MNSLLRALLRSRPAESVIRISPSLGGWGRAGMAGDAPGQSARSTIVGRGLALRASTPATLIRRVVLRFNLAGFALLSLFLFSELAWGQEGNTSRPSANPPAAPGGTQPAPAAADPTQNAAGTSSESRGDTPTPAAAPESSPSPSKDETRLLMNWLNRPESAVSIYGWIQNSYTGNTNGRPRNDSNFSVFPNRLADSWQGNQYYVIVENPVEQNDEVNLGFRIDTLFGNDWQFTKSYGFFDRAFINGGLGVDMPEIYGEIHLPILTEKGLDIRGGRFYDPTGFENAQAVKRPLLSVPYCFNFTPFTLMGALGTLHVDDRTNVYAGAFNGWDRWIDSHYRASAITGMTHTTKSGETSFTSFLLTGPDQLPRFAPANSPYLPTGVVTTPALQGRVNPYYAGSFRTYLDNYVTHNWTDNFTEVAEVFFVHEPNVPGLGPGGTVAKESAWYGFAHWYLYQVTPKVQCVWRAEIFRDQNGAATGQADNYYEMTLGAAIKPKPWLWIRPEARFDRAQYTHPFNDGTRSSQLTLAFDIIVQF